MEINIGQLLSDFILAAVVMYMSDRHIRGLTLQISVLTQRVTELEKQNRDLLERYISDMRDALNRALKHPSDTTL
jgi:hypothetical protein